MLVASISARGELLLIIPLDTTHPAL